MYLDPFALRSAISASRRACDKGFETAYRPPQPERIEVHTKESLNLVLLGCSLDNVLRNQVIAQSSLDICVRLGLSASETGLLENRAGEFGAPNDTVDTVGV